MGELNTMIEMRHVPPKRSPFLKPALTQWPIGLCIATHRPRIFCHSKIPNFWFVTQKPLISDFATPKPIILIIRPKLWLVTIKWSQDFLTERPHNLWSVTERPPIFLVAPVTERPQCLRYLVALVRHSDVWLPPPPRHYCSIFREEVICVSWKMT